MTKLDEKQIKCLLIDKLIQDYPDGVIGVEIPFLAGNRWVDVLLITKDGLTIAFEIKSDLDTLQRLEGQINDYLNTFNSVFIVCSEKFLNEPLIKKISKRVGIIIFDNKERSLTEIKEPIFKHKLLKKNLSYFLWRKDLSCYKTDNNDSVVLLRERLVSKNSIDEIQNAAIRCLRERYEPRFKVFLNEKSKYTQPEDLQYLTKTFGSLF